MTDTTITPVSVQWQMRREEGGLRAPSIVHLSNQIDRSDIRNGGFPLMCGRWAPDGFDAIVSPGGYGKVCAKCAKAARR